MEFNRFQNPFRTNREEVMLLSKIGSKNTYHRCVKELHQAGYIHYNPPLTKFQPVKISVTRLDLQDEEKLANQLDLFGTNEHEYPNSNKLKNVAEAPDTNDPLTKLADFRISQTYLAALGNPPVKQTTAIVTTMI